jgi:hypothetical protein
MPEREGAAIGSSARARSGEILAVKPAAISSENAEADLRLCELEFNRAPSFARLQRLAQALTRCEHWERAAQAWLHVARARQHDSAAFAAAADAFNRLCRHEQAASALACACRLAPDNQGYVDAHAAAIRGSTQPVAQASTDKSRSEL